MLTEIVQQDAEPADAPAETPTEEAAPAMAAKPAPKELTLERELSADDGTFGTIKVGGRVFHTAELPSRGNKINISCIPEGTYDVVLREGSYRVQNVKGRSQITLRTGTYAGDTDKGYKSDSAGEILIGDGRYKIDVVSSEFGFQPQRILTSEETLAEFQKQAGDNFKLTIKCVAKELILEREAAADGSILGTIKVDDKHTFHTAEQLTCIPAGTYSGCA